MGNSTKVDKGYLKTNYAKQKSAGVGFQHTEFYHEATLGSLEINFNSLTLPAEVAAEGFSNPSPSILISADLKSNRGNLSLRSYRGDWVDRIDYTIQSNGKITLKKPAEDGEIFYGKIHNIIRNTLENPDLQNLVAVGELAQGQTVFNVGKQFKVNANKLTQIGEIMVFRGTTPAIMLRNAGNVAASLLADGNYHEVDSNGGYGSTIEFNNPGGLGGEVVIVISTGRLLERPSDSLLQEIETLAGQLDNVIPYIEELAGLAPGTLLATPNNVDLKAFGDAVLNLQTDLAASIALAKAKSILNWGYAVGFTCPRASTNTAILNLGGGNITGPWSNYFDIVPSATLGTSFIAKKRFMLDAHLSFNATAVDSTAGFSVNSSELTTGYQFINDDHKLTVTSGYYDVGGGSGSRIIEVGDVLRYHIATSGSPAADAYFKIIFKVDECI